MTKEGWCRAHSGLRRRWLVPVSAAVVHHAAIGHEGGGPDLPGVHRDLVARDARQPDLRRRGGRIQPRAGGTDRGGHLPATGRGRLDRMVEKRPVVALRDDVLALAGRRYPAATG